MKANVKNENKKKKEKMENFAEFVRKNREKEKKENEKEKEKFSIKIIDFEKEIIREKVNNINLSEKKNNYPKTKRSFSTNSENRKKENNPYLNNYSLLYKNKNESPISKKSSFKSLNIRNQSTSLSKQNSISKIKKVNIENERNNNNNKELIITQEKIFKNPIRINDFRDISSIFKNREYTFSKDKTFKTESNNISFIKSINSSRNNKYNNKKEKKNLTSNTNENNNIKISNSKQYKTKLKTKEKTNKEKLEKQNPKLISKAEEISNLYINQKNNLLYSILGEDTLKILERKK